MQESCFSSEPGQVPPFLGAGFVQLRNDFTRPVSQGPVIVMQSDQVDQSVQPPGTELELKNENELKLIKTLVYALNH